MEYYIKKSVEIDFWSLSNLLKVALQNESFERCKEINLQDEIKRKTGKHIIRYLIMMVYHSELAYRSVKSEARKGLLLPLNLSIIEIEKNLCEVSVIDPTASILNIEDPELMDVANDIRTTLFRIIWRL